MERHASEKRSKQVRRHSGARCTRHAGRHVFDADDGSIAQRPPEVGLVRPERKLMESWLVDESGGKRSEFGRGRGRRGPRRRHRRRDGHSRRRYTVAESHPVAHLNGGPHVGKQFRKIAMLYTLNSAQTIESVCSLSLPPSHTHTHNLSIDQSLSLHTHTHDTHKNI